MSQQRFSGKVALITGAGSGIGRAAAMRLAAEGASVLVTDLDSAKAQETVSAVIEAGGQAQARGLDICDEASAQQAVQHLRECFGRLDVLVNCAGIPGPLGGPTEVTSAEFLRTLEINVLGLFHTCKHSLPLLIANKGNIVNIASVAGLTGSGPPTIGPLVAYTASKHAVIGLTRSIAYQFGADGVRANAVCPGSIVTGMTSPLMQSSAYVNGVTDATPLHRWGQADEVATCIAFLASEDGSFVTGDVLTVDGGFMVAQGKVYSRFAAL